MKVMIKSFGYYVSVVVVCAMVQCAGAIDNHYVSRHTKIVATMGPSTDNPAVIRELLKAGVNVFRLNFSHGAHASHKAMADMIRKEAKAAGVNSALLVDLQGPKLRIGKFKDGKINLTVGAIIDFDVSQEPGDEHRVAFPHEKVYGVIKPGTQFYVDDGKIILEVIAATKSAIKLKTIQGGELSDRKGVDIPKTKLPISAITEKDLNDLAFALTLNPEWVALSFVQDPVDVNLIRSKLTNKNTGIVSKVETQAGLDNLEAIIRASDAIMVARGDLSVDIGPENLFNAQNQMIETARSMNKPVIVATQMMESMINSIRPTNAEVTDVSYAVYNMVDAVMLSGETTIGKNPVLTVKYMDNIIKKVEQGKPYLENLQRNLFNPKAFINTPKFPVSVAQFATANDFEYIVIATKDCSNLAKLRSLTEAVASSRPWSYIIPVCQNTDNKALSFYQLMWGTYPLQETFDFMKGGCNPFAEIMNGKEKKQILLLKTEEVDEHNVESYINMLRCSLPERK